MAQLTHAQKKSFAADMPGILRSNAAAFADKDFNPETRAAGIDVLNAPIVGLTGDRSNKEQIYHAAVALENDAIEKAYEEASRAVRGVEGVLAANHPLVVELHKKRQLMDNEAARGPHEHKPS